MVLEEICTFRVNQNFQPFFTRWIFRVEVATAWCHPGAGWCILDGHRQLKVGRCLRRTKNYVKRKQFYENIPSLKLTKFALETGPFEKERNVSQSQPTFFKGNVHFVERKILEDLKLYLDDELDILKWTDGTAQMITWLLRSPAYVWV